MSLFRRLFGTAQSPATALQGFLAKLTLQHAQTTYPSVKNPRLRLPSAISSTALYAVNKFVVGYSEMVRDTSKAAGISPPAIPYDAVAFEATAYLHYWLMREHLRPNTYDDDEEEEEEGPAGNEDPYFSCLKEAAHISALLIQRYTTFSLPEQFFMNRVISYSAHESSPELFLRVLLSTQARGVPGPVKRPDAATLPLDLAAISYVGIFHKSYLEALPTSVQNLYAADKAGLL